MVAFPREIQMLDSLGLIVLADPVLKAIQACPNAGHNRISQWGAIHGGALHWEALSGRVKLEHL